MFWSLVARSGSGISCCVTRGVSDCDGVPLPIECEAGVKGTLADVGVLLPAFKGTMGLMVGSLGTLPASLDLDTLRGGSPPAALFRGSDLRSTAELLSIRGWV